MPKNALALSVTSAEAQPIDAVQQGSPIHAPATTHGEDLLIGNLILLDMREFVYQVKQ
jgi:hypothetical protein